MNDLDPVSLNLTTLCNVVDWTIDQINPLSIMLLLMLLVVSGMLGMAVVGVCGARA